MTNKKNKNVTTDIAPGDTTTTTENSNSCTLLSEYEITRDRDIEWNNARLRALGLISAREEK